MRKDIPDSWYLLPGINGPEAVSAPDRRQGLRESYESSGAGEAGKTRHPLDEADSSRRTEPGVL